WRRLRGRFAFFGGNSRFAKATIFDFFGSGSVPNPFGARILIAILGEIFAKPSAAVGAGYDLEIGKNLKERSRLKIVNFFLALSQNRQGGGLHTTDRRQLKPACHAIES